MRANEPTLLRRYFAGLAEYTFQTHLGVADPPLVDYVSELLARFVRSEALFRVRNAVGKPVREVAEMMVEAEERIGDAKREIHRHIGDFTLFWTGVYPEAVPRLRGSSGRDAMLDYQAEGKRAYFIASTIETDEPMPPAELLERLSQQFEMCAYGLREVRRLWELRGDEEPPARPILLD